MLSELREAADVVGLPGQIIPVQFVRPVPTELRLYSDRLVYNCCNVCYVVDYREAVREAAITSLKRVGLTSSTAREQALVEAITPFFTEYCTCGLRIKRDPAAEENDFVCLHDCEEAPQALLSLTTLPETWEDKVGNRPWWSSVLKHDPLWYYQDVRRRNGNGSESVLLALTTDVYSIILERVEKKDVGKFWTRMVVDTVQTLTIGDRITRRQRNEQGEIKNLPIPAKAEVALEKSLPIPVQSREHPPTTISLVSGK